MYVSYNGHLWVAPIGSEFLGIEDDVPIVYYRAGWVGPMVLTRGSATDPRKDPSA